MHFEDLRPFRYGRGAFDPRTWFDSRNWQSPLLAVGWIEHPHAYNQGPAPEGLSARIQVLSRQSTDLGAGFQVFMGLHRCSICMENGLGSRSLLPMSGTNLFVPGAGTIYVAPGAVNHYIDEHGYLPPAQFTDAVFACPDMASTEFRQALRAANAGVAPPGSAWADRQPGGR